MLHNKDVQIAGLKQQLQDALQQLSELAELKAAVLSNTERVQRAEEAQQEGADLLLAKVLDLARPVLSTETQTALSEAKAVVQELTEQVNELKAQMQDAQREARQATTNVTADHTRQTGFFLTDGVTFEIKNAPAKFVEDDVRRALATLLEVENVPRSMVSGVRQVYVDNDKDFSIWSIKVFAEDFLGKMRDVTSFSTTSTKDGHTTTRTLYISLALNREERVQRRARKLIVDQARGDYFIRWNRATPYAIHRNTKKRFEFNFNDALTQATLNGATYTAADTEMQGPPNAKD
jgi:hypothetical protein